MKSIRLLIYSFRLYINLYIGIISYHGFQSNRAINGEEICSKNKIAWDALTFNVDFAFHDNLSTNGCLSFQICYAGTNGQFLKPQFNLGNLPDSKIGQICAQENAHYHGIQIDLCFSGQQLQGAIQASFSAQKWDFNVDYDGESPSDKPLRKLSLEFGPNAFRILHGSGDKIASHVLQLGEGRFKKYALYDGIKMLRQNSIGLDACMSRMNPLFAGSNSDRQRHFLLKHPSSNGDLSENGALLGKGKGWTIVAECGQKHECGKRAQTTSNNKKKQPMNALISHGINVPDPTKWPWLVALAIYFLRIRKNGDKEEYGPIHCTGSIINRQYVLTAAHCVNMIPDINLNANEFMEAHLLQITVYAGQTNFRDPNAQIRIVPPENVISNERFITNGPFQLRVINFDLALLKVLEPFDFNDQVMPICLNTRFQGLPDKTAVHIAGWGYTQEFDISDNSTEQQIQRTPTEEQLHEATAKLLPSEDCLAILKERIAEKIPNEPYLLQTYMNFERGLYQNRFCIMGDNRASVQKGDSGSALLYFDRQQGRWSNIGIASHQFLRKNKGEDLKPAIFIKINERVCGWIYLKTRGIVGCGK